MPVYVMLTTLTDEGMKTLKQKPERIKEVDKEVMERFGVKILAQYAVMGPYDFVNILEAPDNDSIVKLAIELGSRGSIRTLTMPAIEVDQLIKDLKELG
ncbi:MAG: GYD domain-containing protein [Aquificaceae bacterium]|nr:GYD domain-containing protein [Aquificaceae bacterium]MCS7277527.1 GYD domain-containing protein [Aquificaceae bacterium]MDW8066715.1 GYD domain-containing protein [Aquificaceae bacterium]MDW8422779.1 GYD domain-containing protein [Aquificaceae bacterium]